MSTLPMPCGICNKPARKHCEQKACVHYVCDPCKTQGRKLPEHWKLEGEAQWLWLAKGPV